MSIDIPMFLNGRLEHVSFFREDGIALRQEVDFYRIGKGIRVYPYPHPEQVTLPRYIPARRVTNKGTVLPDRYFELIMDLCRLGFTSREGVSVKGHPVAPRDFAVAYIVRERERILRETNFGVQRGCVKVVVQGKKAGKPHTFVFSIASENQALGEGTGIPAALGAILVIQGKVKGKGVLPPEGSIDPSDFLGLIKRVLKPDASGKSFEGVLVESVDEAGKVEELRI
jgi:saccharopine dehydrogenase (NAD+, L-lysine-forming)